MQEGEVHSIQGLVLVKAAEDEAFFACTDVDVALQALRANFLQHALHGRVDGADGFVRGLKEAGKLAFARRPHRHHHPV